jgi:hypothetical protein
MPYRMAIVAHLASAVYALGLDARGELQWDGFGGVHVGDGLAERPSSIQS